MHGMCRSTRMTSKTSGPPTSFSASSACTPSSTLTTSVHPMRFRIPSATFMLIGLSSAISTFSFVPASSPDESFDLPVFCAEPFSPAPGRLELFSLLVARLAPPALSAGVATISSRASLRRRCRTGRWT